MKDIFSYSFDEFAKTVESFHGRAAPGVMMGGYMVQLAYSRLPEGGFYNAICETAKCLPDAIQLLTPCSMGNQWLRVVDVGRFALVFYDKMLGEGVRVYVDSERLDMWPEIKAWFLKLTPKEAQNLELLLREIREAGMDIYAYEEVKVEVSYRNKRKSSSISICPSCNEAYFTIDGPVCPACKGGVLPYVTRSRNRCEINDDQAIAGMDVAKGSQG